MRAYVYLVLTSVNLEQSTIVANSAYAVDAQLVFVQGTDKRRLFYWHRY